MGEKRADRDGIDRAREDDSPGARGIPDRIGRYRILRRLGEGGMGVVYEAEQESPRRTVALKVIRPGLASQQSLLRFEHEAQVLGWLLHPGIAQIYEAGTADTGRGPQPFFAMEFVRGVELNEFLETHHVDVRSRLELIAKICDAVHHAHQKGVIHRDLKPGNILVDETGQPKILDFGVARTTHSDARRTTLQTGVGQLIGTLAYMSPEQADGDPRELDIRSDVYSLGVVAFEALCGSLPYDIEQMPIHEMVRTIQEVDPSPLRSRCRTLHRDIETIVAKALEKEKSRRYASAAAMAEDIRRYLRDEPIAARPVSTLYQIKKFAKRNKAVVGGVAAVFLVLVAGIIATGTALNREAKQRKRAEEALVLAERREAEAVEARDAEARERRKAEIEARKAQTVADFTQEMLSAADPSVAGDLDKTLMRLILDTAARRIDTELADEPAIEALIRDTIGSTYSSIGLYEEARPHLDRAVELMRREYGVTHPYTMIPLMNLSLLLRREGEFEESERILRQVLEERRRAFGDAHPDTLRTRINLANVLQLAGKTEEAEAMIREAVATARRANGEDDPVTLTATNNLATFLLEAGHAEEAEALSRRVLDLERETLGPAHPNTILTLNNLAEAVAKLGREGEAEPLLRESLEASKQVFGPDHPDTFRAMNNLAAVMRRTGKLYESEEVFRETLDAQRTRLGPTHPQTLATMNNLAGVLRDLRKYDESEDLFRRCLEAMRETLGAEHPRTLAAMNNLATTLENAGKLAEAEPLQRESLETLRRIVGDEHPTVLALMNNLAHLLQAQGKFDEAEAAYRRLLELAPGVLPAGHWHLGIFEGAWGDCLREMRRFEEAEARCRASYEILEQALGASSRQTDAAVRRLVELYEDWGRPEQAAEWRAKETAPSPPSPGEGEQGERLE